MKKYKITDILNILAITCGKGYTILKLQFFSQFSSVQSLSGVQLFATP